jgi:hypothetical protein
VFSFYRFPYTVVYIAPSMIKHYTEKHEYKPPQEYIDAVLACPPQDSDEFMNLMKPYLHHWERFL